MCAQAGPAAAAGGNAGSAGVDGGRGSIAPGFATTLSSASECCLVGGPRALAPCVRLLLDACADNGDACADNGDGCSCRPLAPGLAGKAPSSANASSPPPAPEGSGDTAGCSAESGGVPSDADGRPAVRTERCSLAPQASSRASVASWLPACGCPCPSDSRP